MSELPSDKSNLNDEVEPDEFEVIKSVGEEDVCKNSLNVFECNYEHLDVNECLQKSMYSSFSCKPQLVNDSNLLSQSLIKKEFEKIVNFFRIDQERNLSLITSLSDKILSATQKSLNLEHLIKENMKLKKINEVEMYKVNLLETKLSNLKSINLEKSDHDFNLMAEEKDSLRSEIEKLKNTIEELKKENDYLSNNILKQKETIINLEEKIEKKNFEIANSNEIIKILQADNIQIAELLKRKTNC